MSKRNLEGEKDENETRKKCASLTEFSGRQHLKGSKILRRLNIKEIGGGAKESRVPFKFCKIMWEKKIRNEDSDESEIFAITTPVPTGMVGLMRKLQESAGRSYQSVPVSVKNIST